MCAGANEQVRKQKDERVKKTKQVDEKTAEVNCLARIDSPTNVTRFRVEN